MSNSAAQLLGLFELDTEGTVIYSRIESAYLDNNSVNSLIGRNFFDEIVSSEHFTLTC